MKRIIFQEPIELNSLAERFSIMIETNNGELTESDLASKLDITERDVREIAERYNYNLYMNADNPYVFKKIKKLYTVIDRESIYRDKVRNKIKTDALAALKRWRIIEQKLGDVNVMGYTMQDILDLEVE